MNLTLVWAHYLRGQLLSCFLKFRTPSEVSTLVIMVTWLNQFLLKKEKKKHIYNAILHFLNHECWDSMISLLTITFYNSTKKCTYIPPTRAQTKQWAPEILICFIACFEPCKTIVETKENKLPQCKKWIYKAEILGCNQSFQAFMGISL